VVLVLRDVLGFPAAEVAQILETSPAAVNSALVRARTGVRPQEDPHEVPMPRSPAEAAVVERFVTALERFDLERLVAVLTEDAHLSMPPEPIAFAGPQAIAGYLGQHLRGHALKLVPTRANHQPALALYLSDPHAPIWRASSLVVLCVRGERISALTRFGDGGLFARFGLPRTLPQD
jgi:RNA polymerase sigma-70 factor (ECF subfamily)